MRCARSSGTGSSPARGGKRGEGMVGQGEEYREGTMEWEVEGWGGTDGVEGGGNVCSGRGRE